MKGKNLFNVLIVAAAIGMTLTCQRLSPTPTDSFTADERAVREADAGRARAFAAGDVEGYVSLFAEDAFVFLTGPTVKGKPSIRQWVSGLIGGPWSGDLAYVVGSYQFARDGPTGDTTTDRGKYLTVWKKQLDGTWKVLIETMNSDYLPPPPGIRD